MIRWNQLAKLRLERERKVMIDENAHKVYMYGGKNLENMTKDELIEAIKCLGCKYKDLLEEQGRVFSVMAGLNK